MALPDLKVGMKLRLNYGDKNINNRTIEVRAIVDDQYVTVRTRRGSNWKYVLEDICFLEMAADAGHLTVAK